MKKSAKDRPSSDLAEPLDRLMDRQIIVQEQMCSKFVVVAGVGRKAPAQMGLVEDDGVIEALPADPISLSAYPICQGDRGAAGWSQMPMACKAAGNFVAVAPWRWLTGDRARSPDG